MKVIIDLLSPSIIIYTNNGKIWFSDLTALQKLILPAATQRKINSIFIKDMGL